MAEIGINDRGFDNQLQGLMDNNSSIEAGDTAGYELCKNIWEFHPLGGKLVEKPIDMAMSKPRENYIEDDPGGRLIKEFNDVWNRLQVTQKIKNTHYLKRAYGASAVAVGDKKGDQGKAIDLWHLSEDDIYINAFDPLNAAGSMVTSQDPNSPDFQTPNQQLTAAGIPWHSSRTIKVFNGAPIYLSYQNSAYGYTGRSVFQRIVFPLRSFLQTMQTDDFVSRKAGVLVAKVQQNSSTISKFMGRATNNKAQKLKAAENGNVLTVGAEDSVESLNLQNIDKAMEMARNDIIANIASGSDTPAKLIKEEAFANGFGEGSEDSKAIVQYIDGVRQQIDQTILFFEHIVQHVAWNEDFYTALKAEYPDWYGDKSYKAAFAEWEQAFKSSWPSLMEASRDETQKGDAEVIKQTTTLIDALAQHLDPENKSRLIEWAAAMINTLDSTKDSPLVLDYDTLATYEPPTSATPPDNKEAANADEDAQAAA